MSGNKLKITIALFFMALNFFGQDTIMFRSGDKKAVKVEEVGTYEIKYHRFDNLGGPIFISSVNEIKKIKYKGGNVDSFSLKVIPSDQSAAVANMTSQAYRLSLFKRKTFSYKGIPLSGVELEQLLSQYPDQKIRTELLAKYAEMNEYIRKSHRSVGLGLGIGLPLPVITSVAGFFLLETYYTPSEIKNTSILIVGGIFVGAAIRITGAVYQKINQNKTIHAKEEIVELFNRNR